MTTLSCPECGDTFINKARVTQHQRTVHPKTGLSRETLDFLAELLASTSIRPTADDFEVIAAKMGKARRELLAALGEAQKAGTQPETQ
jgi:hypothetical protein